MPKEIFQVYPVLPGANTGSWEHLHSPKIRGTAKGCLLSQHGHISLLFTKSKPFKIRGQKADMCSGAGGRVLGPSLAAPHSQVWLWSSPCPCLGLSDGSKGRTGPSPVASLSSSEFAEGLRGMCVQSPQTIPSIEFFI